MSTKKCPYCIEEIKTEAMKCKHCGKFLLEDKNNTNKKELDSDPALRISGWIFGGMFILMGLSSMGMDEDPFLILAMVLTGLVLIPPTTKFIARHSKFKFTAFWKLLAIVLIFFLTAGISSVILDDISPSAETGIAVTETTTDTTEATIEEEVSEEDLNPGLEITDQWVSKNSIGTPQVNITVKNSTGKDIDGLKVQVLGINNFGEFVNANISGDSYFYGYSQQTITNGSTKTLTWSMYLFDSTTSTWTNIYELHFTDGSSWEGRIADMMTEFDETLSGSLSS